MSRRLLLRPALLLVLLAAQPPASEPPEELIRKANAAFLRDDAEAADALYAAAEERAADPGLVAFNKAAVLAKKEQFREAELLYARVLSDAACLPERAAKAWFNRGTCLLRSKQSTPSVFRAAVVCFERSLELNAADEPLRSDARHNLELAKLLWAEANKKAAKLDSPNDPPPDLDPPSAKEPNGTGPEPTDPGPGDGSKDPRATQQPTTVPMPKGGATPTDGKMAGNNPNLQPLIDNEAPQPLSPEQTREYLKQTDARLRAEREKMLRLLSGPDRPGVRDW